MILNAALLMVALFLVVLAFFMLGSLIWKALDLAGRWLEVDQRKRKKPLQGK